MACLPILQIGDPALRVPAEPVDAATLASSPIQQLIDNLIETMRAAEGAGLAATQVGQPVQICILEVDRNRRYPYKPRIPLTVLVNPVLTPLSSHTFSNYEGCLSVPNLRGRVERYAEIGVEAWDRHGEPLARTVRGYTAGTYQHEVDHLAGRLFVDHVTDPESLCTWDNFTRFHQKGFTAEVEALVDRFGS